MQRIKREIDTIREKIGGYPLPAQIAFIWQYYWIPITAAVSLILVLGYMGYRYVTVPGESWFYACFSNTFAPIGDGSDFYDGFAAYAGYDLDEKTMTFNASNYCEPSKETFGNTYYEALVAMLDSGTLDVLVMEEENVKAVGASGRLMDLSSESLPGLEARWGGRFVYCEAYSEAYDAPVPVGIDLSGSRLTGEGSAYPNGAVLGVGAQAPHLGQIEVFLNYLFEEADE